jgi:hypothetical protein
MSEMEQQSRHDAREGVALACRLHGQKRGWHMAATALGISDRTARGLSYGETSGATICPHLAFDFRIRMRRARAAQLRAELRALENLDESILAPHGGSVGLGR